MEFGFQILEMLQCLRSPWLDSLMLFFTSLGNAGILWILLTLGLLIYKPTRCLGLLCGLALLLSLLFCNLLLKPLLQRPRPFSLREMELLIAAPKDFSFPSGHAASSFAFAAALYISRPKAGIAALLTAALISFSRIYLQVHFPGDVLAGAVLGVLCGYMAHVLLKFFEDIHAKRRGGGRSEKCRAKAENPLSDENSAGTDR
ncbi:MAG: phosphatase PAP2 family protein [Bacillota bacterium]|nr:phosphatase PAP2 family protein [Bacillota bacterium]